jgi:hypothetical protein
VVSNKSGQDLVALDEALNELAQVHPLASARSSNCGSSVGSASRTQPRHCMCRPTR